MMQVARAVLGLFKKWNTFKNQSSGSTAIEFAIVAPVFLLLLIGTVQIGVCLIIQNALEGAAREASRYGITGGSSDPGTSRANSIKEVIQQTATNLSGGIIDPGKLVITVRSYSDLQSVGRPEPFTDLNGNGKYDKGESFVDTNGNGVWDADQGQTNSYGLGGQAVLYEISYTYDAAIPFMPMLDKVTMTGRSIVANEEF